MRVHTSFRSVSHHCAEATSSEGGAQLLEFALVLPILLALVIGAWDFGSAFALKDKMTNAARDAARVSVSNSVIAPSGSSAPCAQAGAAAPCTIVAAVNALKQYMTNAGVDLSCIDPSSPSSTGPDPEEYTFTCASVPLLSITIDRSALVPQPTGTPMPATQVVFAYPSNPMVPWFPFFPSQLQTTVTMANLTY